MTTPAALKRKSTISPMSALASPCKKANLGKGAGISKDMKGEYQYVMDNIQDESALKEVASFLRRRASDLAKNAPAEGIEDPFPMPVPRVGSWPEEWKVERILAHTQFSMEQLAKCISCDSEVVNKLVELLVQMPRTLQLFSECRSKRISKLLFDERVSDMKGRGKLLGRPCDFMKADGFIKWNIVGCYELVFPAEGNATHIIHRATKCKVVIPEYAMITKSHIIGDNWSDIRAYVERKPAPIILLKSFFEVGEGKEPIGPNTVFHFKSLKDQVYKNMLKGIVERSKGQGGSAASGSEVTSELEKIKKSKRDANMKLARDASKKRLAEKTALKATALVE